jgi:glycine/sarcosine N-methyltransferase
VKNHTSNNNQLIADFYDWLSEDYDLMTNFEKRFVHEKPFFRLLIEKYKIKTAMDAGCGTGFHSLLLAQHGVEVTAVDISKEMLNKLEFHTGEMKLSVNVCQSNFADLGKLSLKKIDAVFCLGNSLPHLLSDKELLDAIQSFAVVLKQDGILIIQNLNYDRILMQRDRIQSTKESGGTTFIRSYDYGEKFISFNIEKGDKQNTIGDRKANTINLRPIRQNEIAKLLLENGFSELKYYGGISLGEFKPEISKDLVVIARKSLL